MADRSHIEHKVLEDLKSISWTSKTRVARLLSACTEILVETPEVYWAVPEALVPSVLSAWAVAVGPALDIRKRWVLRGDFLSFVELRGPKALRGELQVVYGPPTWPPKDTGLWSLEMLSSRLPYRLRYYTSESFLLSCAVTRLSGLEEMYWHLKAKR